MEQKKYKKVLMPVVRVTLLLILLLCFTVGNAQEKNIPNYSIKVYKTKEKKPSAAYLTIKAVDFENPKEKLLPYTYINNTLMYGEYKPPHEKTYNVYAGKFKIHCGDIGYYTVLLEDLIIKKGDSTVVKFYLKQQTEPSSHVIVTKKQ